MLLQQFAEKEWKPIFSMRRQFYFPFEKILTGKELKSMGIALEKSHPVATHAIMPMNFLGII